MSTTRLTEPGSGFAAAPAEPVGALRRLAAWVVVRSRLWRLVRYGATSGLSTILSEAMLIGLTATGTLGATASALLANVVGSVPAYLLSRYWIWPEANRARIGRQMTLYWVTSIVSTVASTVVTKVVAQAIPFHGATRGLVLGAAFFGTYGTLWLAKFAVYHHWLFARAAVPSSSLPGPELL
ncbi:MAG: GtrA family protein [Acidimicrobiales bacterium]